MPILILKTVGTIVAGIVTVAGLSILTDLVLAAAGLFSPATTESFATWMLVVALCYRTLYAVLGGAVAAALAPRQSMRHVIVLGFLGTLAAMIGVVVGWDYGNVWYPIGIAVTAFPAVYLGGYLRTRGGEQR
jgi:hypothetical protein